MSWEGCRDWEPGSDTLARSLEFYSSHRSSMVRFQLLESFLMAQSRSCDPCPSQVMEDVFRPLYRLLFSSCFFRCLFSFSAEIITREPMSERSNGKRRFAV